MKPATAMAMDVDAAMMQAGGFGRYQMIIFTVISVMDLCVAWHVMSINYIGAEPEYHCKIPEGGVVNETIPWIRDNCRGWKLATCQQFVNSSVDNSTIDCQNGWWYGDAHGNNIVVEWDLVCDMKFGVQLTITVYMFGKLFGALIAPQVADFFGRKPTAICLGLSYVAFGVAKVFTQSYAQFMVMHFFMALSQTGAGLAAFVLLCESVPQSSRATVGLVFMNVWSVGIMTLPLLAYFIPNWRTLQLTMVLPMTITITYYWILPESVHWLVARNRLQEAEQCLQRYARINGCELPQNCLTAAQPTDSETKEKLLRDKDVETSVDVADDKSTSRRYSFIDVYRTPGLRMYGTLMFFIWIVNAGVYYGLSFGTSSLSGNMYLNGFLIGAVEVPGYLMALGLVRWFGRTKANSISLMIAGVPIFAIYFVNKYSKGGGCDDHELGWLVTTLTMTGKMGISSAFNCIYLYTTEFYPTVVRNTGVGISSSVARIGAMLAPLTIAVQKSMPALQPILFGGSAILASIGFLFFPETQGKMLMETPEEWPKWMRGEMNVADNKEEIT